MVRTLTWCEHVVWKYRLQRFKNFLFSFVRSHLSNSCFPSPNTLHSWFWTPNETGRILSPDWVPLPQRVVTDFCFVWVCGWGTSSKGWVGGCVANGAPRESHYVLELTPSQVRLCSTSKSSAPNDRCHLSAQGNDPTKTCGKRTCIVQTISFKNCSIPKVLGVVSDRNTQQVLKSQIIAPSVT